MLQREGAHVFAYLSEVFYVFMSHSHSFIVFIFSFHSSEVILQEVFKKE
jgi:hypothetical protein